ncbi:hypothetical protein [uncultured Enterococcus sp.]|uniref:hypothetical protein n=1 Tax=uncultured Enterococcus sp. TaxID=167972 RepID=UPI00258C78DA|nr:hypothetical protein [uncultured Enterococcus sp.]
MKENESLRKEKPMNLIKRLFKKTHDEPDAPVSPPLKPREMIADPPTSVWQEMSSYQPAPAEDYPLVSLIAAALGAECYPESQFVIRRIEKRNPEFKRVTLIAASIAAGELPDSQFTIKKIAKKNENK